MKFIVFGFIVLIIAVFAWRYIPFLRVPDPSLTGLNSAQPCNNATACGRGGCNGEICGSGGPATVCYPDPKLAARLRGKSCSCVSQSCMWTKPLIGGL